MGSHSVCHRYRDGRTGAMDRDISFHATWGRPVAFNPPRPDSGTEMSYRHTVSCRERCIRRSIRVRTEDHEYPHGETRLPSRSSADTLTKLLPSPERQFYASLPKAEINSASRDRSGILPDPDTVEQPLQNYQGYRTLWGMARVIAARPCPS